MEMNYIKFGNGKKTLVIIPGMSIKPVVENKAQIEAYFALFKTNYTIYLFDRIENPSPNYSCFDMAKDTYQMMKDLNITKCNLYGASQGGMISLAISFLYPDIVEKLVLASTYAKGNKYSEHIFNTWISLADNNQTKLIEHMINHMYSKKTIELYKDILFENFKNITRKQLDNFKIFAKACIDFDITSNLDKIKVKTLILCSKNDLVLSNEGSLYLKEHLNASLIEYSDFGHAVYDEAPDFLNNIYSFLEN